MRILLIEDEEKTSSLIKRGLEENRYKVIAAYDGKSGLSLYKQEQIDLIILDIIMPGMSGIDVCNKIREMDENYPPIL
ncbi:MAG: response regulator, partial [Flavobacteriales bacterium]